jgi:predicted CXXCH cytochrome family protein
MVIAVLSRNPHEFTEKECLKCHTDPDNAPKMLTAPVSKLCKHCHKKVTMASSHPVDVYPRGMSIPGDLPLRDGKVTCSTCHNIHLEDMVILGSKTYFLRRPTSDIKFFCISCHEEDPQNPGHLLIATAHTGNKFRVKDPSQPIDPLSAQCIGCHDGILAGSAKFIIGSGVWQHRGDPHPIGVHYKRARMRNGRLAPLSRLDERIRLFAGRIGCGTCHDMFSKLPGKLVMRNLCTNCHII